jgi:hypothetical protein
MILAAALPALSFIIGLTLGTAQDRRESTVGMPARIEALVLPGSELEAVPADSKCPIVLRVTATYPHGTEFRYDLEYTGLDPGEYDLKNFLRRKDASSTDDLPPIPVAIRSVLPAGQVKPHAPRAGATPSVGGYRTILIAGGVAWVAGLAALLWVGRKRKREEEAARPRPKTLAERLRPLVLSALEGKLSRTERAQLELGLVAYWRRKLGYEDRRPEEALALLREHAEAGPLLLSLEDWLHRPIRPEHVDIAALLAPYRDLPADALESATSAALAPRRA